MRYFRLKVGNGTLEHRTLEALARGAGTFGVAPTHWLLPLCLGFAAMNGRRTGVGGVAGGKPGNCIAGVISWGRWLAAGAHPCAPTPVAAVEWLGSARGDASEEAGMPQVAPDILAGVRSAGMATTE